MTIRPKAVPVILSLGAVSLLAVACSRGEKAVETAAPAAAAAPPSEISIPGTGIFPESMTSSADGTVYIGSVGKAEVYKAAPGAATAEPFIAPGTGGLKQVFGVLADDTTGTLWVCSNDLGGGAPGAGASGPSALFAFDLASGAYKTSYPLPAGGFCNDTAIAPNGDLYAADTNGMQALRLAKGGTALEAWSPAGAFGPPGGVVDGIAVLGNRLIVGTLATGKLFAVDIGADGKAGAVTELALSAPVGNPDGIRSYGADGLLVADGNGKVHHVIVNGGAATVTSAKDGLEGVVAVTTVGKTGYALEGQLAIMMAKPGTTPPAEKPYHAVGFPLP